jgi:hypothetical protein
MPKIEIKTLDEALMYADKLEKDAEALTKQLKDAEEKAKQATEANNKNFKALLSQTKTHTAAVEPQDPFDKFKF